MEAPLKQPHQKSFSSKVKGLLDDIGNLFTKPKDPSSP